MPVSIFDDIVSPNSAGAPPQRPGVSIFNDITNPPASPQQEQKPDEGFSVLGTLKQIPLGVARGLTNMAAGMAPAGMAEAIAANPRLLDTIHESGQEIPTPQDYYTQGKEFLTRYGVEGENSPKNIYEKMASGAGESLPWGVALGGVGPGAVGNIVTSMAGGAGGAGAEEMVSEKNKPIANVVGNLVGSLGMAGALSVARGIMNLSRPARTLPGPHEEFAIPATRGMIEGDQAAIAEEQAMLRGARGKLAQRIMQRNATARQESIDEAGGVLRSEMGEPTTPEQAADIVSHGLRTRAEGYRAAGNQLYESAAAKNAWASADRFSPTTAIDDALTREGIALDRFGNYPASNNAMSVIRRLGHGTAVDEIGTAIEGMGPRVLSLRDMEQARKAINKIRAPYNTEDGRALGSIKRAYDDWETDTVNRALFVGDKTAIDDIKAARPLWRRYRQMIDADPRRDYTKTISSIVNEERTAPEVANLLFNTNSIGLAGKSSRTARYLRATFGEDSVEWGAIKSAFVHKAMTPEKTNASIADVAASIEKNITGKGRALAAAVLSPEERNTLMRYAGALRRVTPRLDNPSGTSYARDRTVWSLITGGAGLIAAGGAYQTGNARLLAIGAIPLIRDVFMARKALRATTEVVDRPRISSRVGRSLIPSIAELNEHGE